MLITTLYEQKNHFQKYICMQLITTNVATDGIYATDVGR